MCAMSVHQHLDARHAGEAMSPPTGTQPFVPGSVGDEYRELARQRRFVRSGEPAAPPPQPTTRVTAVERPARRPGERLSRDPINLIMEMSRLADRLIEARDALAAAQAHATQLEQELGRSRAEIAAANDRVLAARVLVRDAQAAAHAAAERCAFLEGRCDALEAALDIAINASITKRWRWRRQARRDQHDRR